MLFSIGTRVRFVHSDDAGVVTALLDDGMVKVLLDDGFEIPAFLEDLKRLEDEAPSVKAKIVPGKISKTLQAPERPPVESQYTILRSVGIQLAFDPVGKGDAQTDKFIIYLINDTRYDLLFTFGFSLSGKLAFQENGKLSGPSVCIVGEMKFDALNESPEIDLQCWRILTDGTGPRQHKSLKLKPKQFFKRTVTAPLLNKPVHLFKVFDNLKETAHRERQEDLKAYTKRKAGPVAEAFDDELTMHDVIEMAEFIPELDLHIEQLVENHHKLSNAEILHIQLRHFDDYIEKSIRLGVRRVYIIHGVGKGRLRDAIATRLFRIPEVETFKNEYHPRYGYGATEVIFLSGV